MIVKLRLYRSHDFDLMTLSLTGIAVMADVGKKALEACFRGTEYRIDISDRTAPLPDNYPSTMVVRVYLNDDDAPGIEEWFRAFDEGARNNMVKCLIRKSLSDVPVWAYRSDGWISAKKANEEALEAERLLSRGNAHNVQPDTYRETERLNKEPEPYHSVKAEPKPQLVPKKQAERTKPEPVAQTAPTERPVTKPLQEDTAERRRNGQDLTGDYVNKHESAPVYTEPEEEAASGSQEEPYDAFGAMLALQGGRL